MRVVIVRVERNNETQVGVRAVRDGRPLFKCIGSGAAGRVRALDEARAYCRRHGHAIATQTVVEAA